MNVTLSQEQVKTIQQIIAKEVGVPIEEVTPDALLHEDFNVDSLTMVEISLHLEDHFGIAIPDDEFTHIKTIGDVYDLVSRLTRSAT